MTEVRLPHVQFQGADGRPYILTIGEKIRIAFPDGTEYIYTLQDLEQFEDGRIPKTGITFDIQALRKVLGPLAALRRELMILNDLEDKEG